MLSMFSTAAARSFPIVRAEGSLNVRSEAVPAPAGDGVAGAFALVVEGAATGAAGTAGVCTVAGAGVDGAGLLDEAPTAGLGCSKVSMELSSGEVAIRAFETMHTMNPFSSML